MKLLLLLVMCWSYCCCSFLPAEQLKQNQNGTDTTSSPSDGLSAGEIIGHFFEAVGAGAALLTIIHLIGLFITIIYVAFCKKKNNKKKEGENKEASNICNDCCNWFNNRSTVHYDSTSGPNTTSGTGGPIATNGLDTASGSATNYEDNQRGAAPQLLQQNIPEEEPDFDIPFAGMSAVSTGSARIIGQQVAPVQQPAADISTLGPVTLQNYPYVLRVLQKENANSSLLGTMLGVGKVSVPVAQISCADYLSTVLEKWENGKRKDYEYTWEVLKSALNGCDHGALVQKIEKEGRNGPINIGHEELLQLLVPAHADWQLLGTFLGVDTTVIDQSTKSGKLMLLTIQKWINDNRRDPAKVTIAAIIEALESDVIGNRRLANEIREDPEIQRIYGYKPPDDDQQADPSVTL